MTTLEHPVASTGLRRRPGHWALPPQPPETWIGHRITPLLIVIAAIAVAVPELILFPGAAPEQLERAVAYAIGGLMALACSYLLVIQASIAEDNRLAWAGGGFAILLLVDLGRSLASSDPDLERGLSLTWLTVLPLIAATVNLSRWGLQLLFVPLLVIAFIGLRAVDRPISDALTFALAGLAIAAGLWWIYQLRGPHPEAWIWPGIATLLVPVAAIERTLDWSPLTGAIVEVLVLLAPTSGLAYVTFRGYLIQSRRWRRLERDVKTLKVSALLPGLSITPADIAGLPAEGEMAALIAEVHPHVALQPVIALATGETMGQEALSRFGGRVPTERWFRGAALHGFGAELERVTLRAALGSLHRLADDQFLAVNVSPASLYDDEVMRLLWGTELARLVIEVTEHDAINDYEDTRRILSRLRSRGARIAIDDVGAGYASLKHLLLLQPDMVKLDTSLTRDIHKSPKQQAMVRSLVAFADEVGAVVLAEGVEIAEQLQPLLAAGVSLGQGWHLGVPLLSDGSS